jgi:hypothetical protein
MPGIERPVYFTPISKSLGGNSIVTVNGVYK